MRNCIFFLFFLPTLSLAQEILPVLNTPMEEIARSKQLSNDSARYLKDVSFTVRPIRLTTTSSSAFYIQSLPFQYQQQFDSRRPLRYTDGSMIPARGWQFQYSGGVQAAYKGLTVLLRPEFNWAFNADYPSFPQDHFPIVWKYYYQWQNRIDVPERFSQTPFRKAYAGQSRIQYAFKGLAVGVSTENLWWGPGRFNALLMTNNAPGFFHYTFHSDKPIQTPIGSLEWQLIAGKILPSGEEPLEPLASYDGQFLYMPKSQQGTRIIRGGVITWKPKWLNGLFVGTDALWMRYANGIRTASMGSIFARYIMPTEHAEVYLQYGRSDRAATLFNLVGDSIPRGYVAGFRKMIPLKKQSSRPSYFQLAMEITQLNAPTKGLVNKQQSWYTDGTIRHGYTHEGQVLGASIGPGSNTQRLEFAFVQQDLRVGLELERWVHNQDFYYNLNANAGSLDFNRQWVDLMASLVWNIPIKKLMLFGQFSAIRAINYQWKAYIPEEGPVTNYFDNGWDFINYHVRSGVQVKL